MRYRNKYMCALEKWTKSPNLSVHISFSVSCVYVVYFGYYETDIAMTCGIFFSLGKLMYIHFLLRLSCLLIDLRTMMKKIVYDMILRFSRRTNTQIGSSAYFFFLFGCTPRIDERKKLCSRHHSSCQKSINVYRSRCQYVLRISKYAYLLHSFKHSGFSIISMNLVSKQLSNVN